MKRRSFSRSYSISALICGGVLATIGFTSPLIGADASPSDYGFATPSPIPTLPAGMDVYTPPLLGDVTGPQAAEFTRTAAPDDTIIVAGPDFTKNTKFDFYGQTAAGNDVTLETTPCAANAIAASVILPSQLPTWSTYLIWPKNGSTYGKAMAVNRTEAWWIGCDQVLLGDTVSVYGRNLSHANSTTTSWIYMKRAGAASGVWVTPTSVNPYQVSFQVPLIPGAPNGDPSGAYEVWVHNGHGGQFGWSGPLTLTILPKSPWAGQSTSLFNVKMYGGKGDGVTDDSQAIQSALNAAGNAAPASIYFPAGTYVVNGMINLKDNVSWVGDSRDTTSIQVGPTFASSSETWWSAFIYSDSDTLNHIELKNLFIDSHGFLGTQKLLVRLRHHQYVKLTSCRFNWKGSPFGFDLGGNTYLTIANTEFIGDLVFLGNGKQVMIHDNNFRMTDFGTAALATWGGSELAVINNTAQDYDSASGSPNSMGSGRFFVAQCHPDSNRDFYIANNTTTNMAPPVNAPDANQGEQVLFEVGTSTLAASPVATTSTTAQFISAPPANAVEDAVIVKGRGTGQFRQVTSVNGNTITVASPWAVTPDATSVIGVGAAQTRTVVYHNRLDGKKDYPTFQTASVPLSMYGNVTDVIFANNTITNMRTGLADEFSQVPDPSTPMPSAVYFNLIANNSVAGAYRGIRVYTDFLTQSFSNWGHLGNTYRENILTNITTQGIFFQGDENGYVGGFLEQDVFEHNNLSNVPQAVWFSNHTYQGTPATQFDDLVFYKNSFALGSASPTGAQAINLPTNLTSYWSSQNTWLGFPDRTADTDTVPPQTVVATGASAGQDTPALPPWALVAMATGLFTCQLWAARTRAADRKT